MTDSAAVLLTCHTRWTLIFIQLSEQPNPPGLSIDKERGSKCILSLNIEKPKLYKRISHLPPQFSFAITRSQTPEFGTRILPLHPRELILWYLTILSILADHKIDEVIDRYKKLFRPKSEFTYSRV